MQTVDPGQSGFTLLELLVAVALFATISTVAYSGLAALLRTDAQLRDGNTRWQDLQLALQLMEQDLSQAVNRPARDAFGTREPAMRFIPGSVQELSFSRFGSGMQADGAARLQRVSYRWDGSRLTRLVWPYPDRVQGSQGYEDELLNDLRAVDFNFHIDHQQTRNSWPDPGSSPGGLPAAVSISLQTRAWGRIERLFLVRS